MGDDLMCVPESSMTDEHGNPAVAHPPAHPPARQDARAGQALDDFNDGIIGPRPARRAVMGDVHLAEAADAERQRDERDARLAANPADAAACLQDMGERQRRDNVGGAQFYRPTENELDRCVADRGADRRAEAARQHRLDAEEHGAIGPRQPGTEDMVQAYADALGDDDQAIYVMQAAALGQEVPSPRDIQNQRALSNLCSAGPAMDAAIVGMAARDATDGEDVESMTSDHVNEVADTVAPVNGLLDVAMSTRGARQAAREPGSGPRATVLGIDEVEDDGLAEPVPTIHSPPADDFMIPREPAPISEAERSLRDRLAASEPQPLPRSGRHAGDEFRADLNRAQRSRARQRR